jgi:hypothetical protein
MAGPQEVRPELGLHHNEETRFHETERPVYDKAEIEREIEDFIDVLKIVAGNLLSRHRRGREEQTQLRIAFAQLRQQCAGGQDLAHRHGMNPD